MYFSRLVTESEDGEFRLDRFERFNFIAFASIREIRRSAPSFDLIKFKAEREREIAFINPLGDSKVAERWLQLVDPAIRQVEIPTNSDWIGYLDVATLLDSSQSEIDIYILQETEGADPEPGVGELFDRAIEAMRTRSKTKHIAAAGRSEAISVLRSVWWEIVKGMIG